MRLEKIFQGARVSVFWLPDQYRRDREERETNNAWSSRIRGSTLISNSGILRKNHYEGRGACSSHLEFGPSDDFRFRDRQVLVRKQRMAVEPRVTGNTKPLVPLFTKASDCVYTSCYCEENVWKLCQEVATKHGSELQHCHVAFISNPGRSVPLWRQRAGKDEDKVVIWDYHAILIYAPDERAVVYDLDSALPFPTHFWKYATETFRSDDALEPELHRRFRLIPASLYLQHFASNRQHMKREDGTWIKRPPDYPPISTPTCKDNLDSFINMEAGTGLGVVMSLKQLINRFYRPNVNTPAPPPPQPQATPT